MKHLTLINIDGLDGGLFLIVDVDTDGNPLPDSTPMLVGTPEYPVGSERPGCGEEPGCALRPGQEPRGRDGDLVENKTVTQGETVYFEVTGKVPSIAGMDNTYTYTFEDYADEGLTINLNSIEVKSGNNSLDKGTTGASGDYTVSPDGDTVPGKGENV